MSPKWLYIEPFKRLYKESCKLWILKQAIEPFLVPHGSFSFSKSVHACCMYRIHLYIGWGTCLKCSNNCSGTCFYIVSYTALLIAVHLFQGVHQTPKTSSVWFYSLLFYIKQSNMEPIYRVLYDECTWFVFINPCSCTVFPMHL